MPRPTTGKTRPLTTIDWLCREPQGRRGPAFASSASAAAAMCRRQPGATPAAAVAEEAVDSRLSGRRDQAVPAPH
eukprot:8907074-Lingulodinium_polyedra.AAC.1